MGNAEETVRAVKRARAVEKYMLLQEQRLPLEEDGRKCGAIKRKLKESNSGRQREASEKMVLLVKNMSMAGP